MSKLKETKCLFNDKQTPEGMISVSQLQTFLSCRKKWAYNYIDELKPRVERSYLTIGKLCHKGMQTAMQMLWEKSDSTLEGLTAAGLVAMQDDYAKYRNETPLLSEEIPEVEQTWDDAVSVFIQALQEFDPTKYEVVSVVKNGKKVPALELHFKIPCPPTKGLHGYIDAILRDRETGFVWCTDYKFRKSLAPDEDEAFNIQNAVYARACGKMDIPITGTMTWQHVNTPAADPQLLKTGAVSRTKIRTTWEHYAAFCLSVGQDPENYREEMQEKLADSEWCRPTLEYRNEDTILRIWCSCILPVAKMIKKARAVDADNYRSLYPWNCKMCQYQSLCQGELRDYDIDEIIAREYTRRGSNASLVQSEGTQE